MAFSHLKHRTDWALLILLFYAGLAFGENGHELLQSRLPFVYNAMVSSFGEARTQTLLQSLQEEHIDYLVAKLYKPLKAAREGKLDSTSRNHITNSILNISALAATHPSEASVHRMGEMEFGSSNPIGQNTYRPTGIYYRIEEGKIIITGIVDAKVRTPAYDQKYTLALLNYLKSKGFYTKDGQFLPENVYLNLDGNQKPIGQSSLEDAESLIRVFTLAKPRKPPSVQVSTLGIRQEELAKAVSEITETKLDDVQLASIEKQRNDYRSRVLQAKIKQINQWLSDKKDWPRHTAKAGTEERILAQWTRAEGGQAEIYKNFVTPENKAHWKVRRNIHPDQLLNEWISQHKGWPHWGAQKGSLEAYLVGWIKANGAQPGVFLQTLTYENQLILRPELKDNPEAILNEWIAEFKRWPEPKHSESSLENSLSKWIASHGGRSAVFRDKLPLQNQSLWRVRLEVQPDIVVNRWILLNGGWPSRQAEPGTEERGIADWIERFGGRELVREKVLLPGTCRVFLDTFGNG